MIRALTSKLAALAGMAESRSRKVVVAVLIVLSLVLVAGVIWLLWPIVPGMVWIVLASVLAGLALVWLVFRGIPKYMEHRFIRKHSGDLSPGNASDEQAPIERMENRLAEARAVWEQSPEHNSLQQPLYRTPFYLVLGDEAAGQESLLRAAAQSSPFPVPQRAARGEREWLVWWFHKDAVAIETSPSFPCDQGDRVTRGIWYQALQLLKSARPKQPLNGFLILVSAPVLLRDTTEIRDYGQRLRRLVDEALAQLQVVAPVYVLITHLESLPGADAFLQSLPKESGNQIFGHLFPDGKTVQDDWQQTKPVFSEIESRLHAIRLGMLSREADANSKAGCFDFVSQVGALGAGLEVFAKALFEEKNMVQRKVLWRGLFLTASAATKPFVSDLFLKFLPADQPLAGRSGQRRVMSWIGVLAVAGFAALLSAGLIWQLRGAHEADTAASEVVEGACGRLGQSTDLAALDGCRSEIVELDNANSKRSFSFGLNASERSANRLRTAFAHSYRKTVLSVVDQSIDDAVAQKKTSFLEAGALAQRVWLIDRCLESRKSCIKDEADLFVIAASPSDFPLGNADDPEDVQRGARALLAFAAWAPDALLKEVRLQSSQRLKQVLSVRVPSLADLAEWGDRRSKSIDAADLWRPGFQRQPTPAERSLPAAAPTHPDASTPDELTRLLGTGAVRIEGAESAARNSAPAPVQPAENSVSGGIEVPGIYRNLIARTIVQPFAQIAAAEHAQSAQAIKRMAADYGTAYYGAWARFLIGFHEGIDVWRGATAELTQQMSSAETPHTRLFAAFSREVSSLKQDWVPVPVWVAALEATLAKHGPTVSTAARDLAQSVGQDINGRESYDLARAVFSTSLAPDAPPAAKSALKALAEVERPSTDEQKKMGPGDYGPWTAAQGPLRTSLYLLAYRTVEFLDETWKRDVAAGMAGKVPKDQIDYLVGGGGRLKWFSDTWLRTFYKQDGLPVAIAGVVLPLHPDFLAYLGQLSGDQQRLAGGPIAAGTVQVYPSSLGSLPEGPGGTVFELVCQSQKFSAFSKGTSLIETKATIFWSPRTCMDAVIRIALPPAASDPAAIPGSPPPAQLYLVKTYPGADGYINFLKDLKSGSKIYRLADFSGSYAPAQWRTVTEELTKLRVGNAKVNLKIELSPDMEVFLSGPRKPPSTLIPPRLG